MVGHSRRSRRARRRAALLAAAVSSAGGMRPRRKVCNFCADKVLLVDYKDVGRLRRYISDRGKIEPRRKTGTCAHHQRALATAIKRARHIGNVPFTGEHIGLSGIFPR